MIDVGILEFYASLKSHCKIRRFSQIIYSKPDRSFVFHRGQTHMLFFVKVLSVIKRGGGAIEDPGKLLEQMLPVVQAVRILGALFNRLRLSKGCIFCELCIIALPS